MIWWRRVFLPVQVPPRAARAILDTEAEALRADDGALHHRLVSIREEAGLPEEISALRVFDVIAWMDGKNRRLGEPSDLER
ncbi:DUF6308 family protein [Rhodococcus sp. 21391]|uniref:DUF6308 family protein n=1 Tax=Rhodococcus sp. 21391 TaxID=2683591 RepID=UPI00192AF5AB|nr:DUF6308 family protein [Rhodococcus sp. 21391]QQZ19448.1 hypothetical protein GO592_40360 [Rhodococcus sp. 21391]